MSKKTKKIIYPVKFFIGILIKDIKIKHEVESVLKEKWGDFELVTDKQTFVETSYYEKEMGDNLFRYWIFFKELINKEKLAEIKNMTNDIESIYAIGDNRVVNLDPGYISQAKVVLASTKNYTHRIYIGNNIFAEVTLYFKNKKFQSWPWTYPDYKTENAINLFTMMRNKYLKSNF